VLLLAIALAAPTALATSGSPPATAGYGPQGVPKPSSGTSPSKANKTPPSTSTPTKTTPSATTSSAPSTTSAKASSLPFTGFDLRWTVGAGLLLMGMGFSIVTMQRLKRRNTTGR